MGVEYKFKIGDKVRHVDEGHPVFRIENRLILDGQTPGYLCSWADGSGVSREGSFAEINLTAEQSKRKNYGTRDASGFG